MATGVNLDALIPREDFAAGNAPMKGTMNPSLGLGLLRDDFFTSGLRKPDFQRETSAWVPAKIVDLIAAFLDDDLIPAIILWRSGQFVFVIDGAHRLSAMLAWVYDDYGDKSRSVNYFQNQVPEEQIRFAEATRKLVEERIGTYASYMDANRSQYASEKVKERIGMMNTNSFIAQWVPAVDAIGAENSFFKINQAPTPVDPIEKRILRGRLSATAIATRAINRGGTGHKYWGEFAPEVRQEIEKAGKAVHGALYNPPLGDLPIKTSDVPVGGRGYSSLPFVFDLVSLVNGVANRDSLPTDHDGTDTVRFIKTVEKRLELVTTTHPGSLGLHPLVYFYTRGGAFQPIAFLAVMQVVQRLADRGKLDDFTRVRARFEQFLMARKEAFTLIVKRQGAGARSRPAVEAFIERTLAGLYADQSDEEIIAELAKDDRFAFFAVPPPIRGDGTGKRTFNRSTKTAAFVSNLISSGVRCGICGGLLHRNSMSTDHIVSRSAGGGADHGNAQPTHMYCNTGYKTRQWNKLDPISSQ